MNIPRFSVRNPIAVNLLMWLVILGGVHLWFDLVRELFPNSDPERVEVRVAFPGATPEEVEKLVVRPVEKELMALDDVKEVRSEIIEGLAIVGLELDTGAGLYHSLAETRAAMGRILPDLPDGIQRPEIIEVHPRLPVITVVVHGSVPEENLRRVAREVREELLQRPGITDILVSGVRRREIWIEVLPEKLEQFGLTLAEVGRVLGESNLDVPGGQLKSERGNLRVRTLGEEDRAFRIEQIVIRGRTDGVLVRLVDIARVRETFEDRAIRGRFSGRPAVALTVFKTSEEDAVKIAREVREYVRTRGEKLGGSIQLSVMTDLARLIDGRLSLLMRNGLNGFLLVVLVLALFLDLRVAFWIAVGIPISFLGTFILMYFLGGTINLISIFGLILVLGIIVDDAIVIGENVFTRMRTGMHPKKAAVIGTNEVAIPVVAAVFTSIITFLPLLFIGGQVGVMLAVMPVVVIAALATSLLEAFIILPCHLAYMHQKPYVRRIPRVGPFLTLVVEWMGRVKSILFERWLPGLVGWGVRFALRWRYVTVAVSLLLLVVTVGVIEGGVVPFQYFQEIDAETVAVDLEMAAGTPEERTLEVIRWLEEVVGAAPEVASLFSAVGVQFSDEGRTTPADPATVGQLIVELQPVDEREAKGLRTSKELLADFRARTGQIAGVNILRFVPRVGGPSGEDIEIRLEGADLALLEGALGEVRNRLRQYEGVSQITDDLKRGKIEVRIRLREVGRLIGLTTRHLALQLRHGFFGLKVQEIQGEDDRVTLRVLFPRSARSDLQDLEHLRIATPGGGRPLLEEVASIQEVRGFGALHRVQGRRSVTLRAEVDEGRTNTGQITDELVRDLADLETRFPGVVATFGGKRQNTLDSVHSLTVGFPIALFGVYMIVAILFRSYSQPLIVMLAIPFSLVGAVFGHYWLGYPFTVFSMIGYVALAGVVVNDSLILVDFINRARRQGVPVVDAAVEGAQIRCRAIILTSITTVAGLAPLLTERSYQAQFLIPMGISIVYGLGFATLITLILIPTIYTVMADIGSFFRWLATGRWAAPILAICSCRRKYHVPPRKAGKQFPCVGCGALVRVPGIRVDLPGRSREQGIPS